jgi:hypothetical protein
MSKRDSMVSDFVLCAIVALLVTFLLVGCISTILLGILILS